jgi:hypothetical protein
MIAQRLLSQIPKINIYAQLSLTEKMLKELAITDGHPMGNIYARLTEHHRHIFTGLS